MMIDTSKGRMEVQDMTSDQTLEETDSKVGLEEVAEDSKDQPDFMRTLIGVQLARLGTTRSRLVRLLCLLQRYRASLLKSSRCFLDGSVKTVFQAP